MDNFKFKNRAKAIFRSLVYNVKIEIDFIAESELKKGTLLFWKIINFNAVKYVFFNSCGLKKILSLRNLNKDNFIVFIFL
jgi:hypothetical protein